MAGGERAAPDGGSRAALRRAAGAALHHAVARPRLTTSHARLDAWARGAGAPPPLPPLVDVAREIGDALLMTALDALRAGPRAWLATRLIEARVLARADPYVLPRPSSTRARARARARRRRP